MPNEVYNAEIFCNYYAKWIDVYKNGAVRKVTMDKYLMTVKPVRLISSLSNPSVALPETPQSAWKRLESL